MYTKVVYQLFTYRSSEVNRTKKMPQTKRPSCSLFCVRNSRHFKYLQECSLTSIHIDQYFILVGTGFKRGRDRWMNQFLLKPPLMMSSSANYRPFLRFFSSYLPSGLLCQVSELTIHEENGRRWEKCLFGRNWPKISWRWTSGHLQG